MMIACATGRDVMTPEQQEASLKLAAERYWDARIEGKFEIAYALKTNRGSHTSRIPIEGLPDYEVEPPGFYDRQNNYRRSAWSGNSALCASYAEYCKTHSEIASG